MPKSHHKGRHAGIAATLAALALATGVVRADTRTVPRIVTNLQKVTVVAVAPGVLGARDLRRVSRTVQSINASEMVATPGGDVAKALDRNMAGVNLNAVQGNAWQADLQYHGFFASPVLGTPQGIAVYQDGVRLNDVFGDTVDWDLLPSRAVDGATLASGGALFGQNALGGSIDLRSKSGFTMTGTNLGMEGGSWARRTDFIESGGNNGSLGYYVLADRISDAGWRDLSPSRLRHETGALSYRRGSDSVDVRLATASTELTGNGATPAAWLSRDRSAIYTAPDETKSRLLQQSMSVVHRWGDQGRVNGTLFSRRVITATFNGDASEYKPCEEAPAALCDDKGVPVRTDKGIAPSRYDATANMGTRQQRASGGTVSVQSSTEFAGLDNQWLAGAEVRNGSLVYQSSQRLGQLDDQRRVVALADTLSDAAVSAAAHTADWAVYVNDQISLGHAWTLDAGLRFNNSRVRIADRSGENPALDGTHVFRRANPVVGVTWTPSPSLTTHASYAESTRVPTPVELTCADRDAPCRLPDDFVSDPRLAQVVARSIEWGARGLSGVLHWSAAIFRTTSAHDIEFQSTGGSLSNRGFFANAGSTRREGFEASVAGRAGSLRWRFSYTFLRAVYLSGFDEYSANHPDADGSGTIHVRPGDRLPGLPRNNVKVDVDFPVNAMLSFGVDGRYLAGQYLRGDDSNQLSPTGGYALFDGYVAWTPSPRWKMTLTIGNLLDRHYATFGTLGAFSSRSPAATDDPRFLGPGAPRSWYLSMVFRT